MRDGIEQRAEDIRAGELELPPKRMLRPASPFGNWCQHQRDSAVGEIGAGDDILDPTENDGAGGRKENFVLIGEQPTCGEGTATRQPAESIRQPRRQAAKIIEGQNVAVAGRDEQLPLIARQGPHRRHAGVEQRPQMLREDGLRRSLFAGDGQDRIGLPARSAPNSHAKTSTKPFSLARFKNGASASVAPPRTGNGSHLPDSGAGRASNCGRRSAGSEKSGLLSVLRQNRRSELVIVATKQVSCTA